MSVMCAQCSGSFWSQEEFNCHQCSAHARVGRESDYLRKGWIGTPLTNAAPQVPRDPPMSRRDHFAAAALHTLNDHHWTAYVSLEDSRQEAAKLSSYAVMLADALIAELDKP